MRICLIAGGVGGARFTRGLLAHLDQHNPAQAGTPPDATGPPAGAEVTVIGNTGDDITLFGLRVCPDLDTVMYTLGGGIDERQGWGRADDTHVVQHELAAYGARPHWFGLGDRDIATHVARSQLLGLGMPLSQVTQVLCERWGLPARGVRLLPMTDDPVETHVVIDDEDGGQRAVHFQEWWVRYHAATPAHRFVALGMDAARPAPGVLDAIRDADVVLLPPSNPVVSIGIVLAVPGLRDALRDTQAPVVGVSPLIGGRPVRGHADACLAAIGVSATSEAVAELYCDFLAGWLVDDSDPRTASSRWTVRRRPLLMSDVPAAAEIAGAALDLALQLAPDSGRVPSGA
ncbi:MAG: 2-phospho-L-lactate transferase [Angustibacter sp.]